jgi:hypothetical protein
MLPTLVLLTEALLKFLLRILAALVVPPPGEESISGR